jgi:exonuclease III
MREVFLYLVENLAGIKATHRLPLKNRMKLISLNTYGGHCFDELMRFVVTQAETTDVFCFQEVQNSSKGAFISNGVRADLFQELSQALSDFQGFFAVSQQNYDQTAVRVEGTDTGVATFVRNSLQVKNSGDFFIYAVLIRSCTATTIPFPTISNTCN